MRKDREAFFSKEIVHSLKGGMVRKDVLPWVKEVMLLNAKYDG
jgi:hypothetical protein|tara:strand:- start:87 stop:215 length:129 start_codon:yes stop_codon:yes gene_type:complete